MITNTSYILFSIIHLTLLLLKEYCNYNDNIFFGITILYLIMSIVGHGNLIRYGKGNKKPDEEWILLSYKETWKVTKIILKVYRIIFILLLATFGYWWYLITWTYIFIIMHFHLEMIKKYRDEIIK